METFLELFIKYIIIPFSLLLTLAAIGVVSYGAYDILFSKHEYINLQANEWKCTNSKRNTYTIMVMVGKIMVPLVNTNNECIEYKRK